MFRLKSVDMKFVVEAEGESTEDTFMIYMIVTNSSGY